MNRRIARVTEAPFARGFLGDDHLAAMRVSPEDYAKNDPFFLLMDDNLDRGETFTPMGEPHPHAGFETVTFFLEGTVRDAHEGGLFEAGDLQWMTAGRGVIHSEDLEAKGKLRILQLWLILPKRDRAAPPRFQEVHAASVPIQHLAGAEVRLYSGRLGTLRSSTRNYVPVTLADLRLQPGASVALDLPASYNGFALLLDGGAKAGADDTALTPDQIGWLDRPDGAGPSTLRLTAGDAGARVLLYAGQPQGDALVASGPFIADTREDLQRLYAEYRAGRFPRMSELSEVAQAAGSADSPAA